MDKKKPTTAGGATGVVKQKSDPSETKDNVSDSNGAIAAASEEHTGIRSSQPPYTRMVQNFLLVWLAENIDIMHNDDFRNTITRLRQVVNTVNTFADVNRCIDYITDIMEENIFMIVSETTSKIIMSIIQDIPQVISVYIFCGNKARHEQWDTQWPKVKGVFTEITPVCEALKQATQDCDQNAVSMSFVGPSSASSNKNLDQLDQSFMYTQILKEILLTIDFQPVHFQEFITYCREQFTGNSIELNNIDKLQNEYRLRKPVWWYTYQCFIYPMLNRALRTMEVDLIIRMGFFIRDLHEHIAQLHSEQYGGHRQYASFTVFRGQGLSQADFDQLKKTQGGLLSFNNFLSTSKNRNVSLKFAQRTIATSGFIGILFVMTIDSSISSTPFACIRDVSYYQKEEEILFSMHSVFRTGSIKQIDGNNRLWQVELTLTCDSDPQLHTLTEYMRQQTFPHLKGWDRLANLLIKLGQFNKAQQVCEVLLNQSSDERAKADIYHMLALTKHDQGKYAEAIIFDEKSININQNSPSPSHADLAASYHNIGQTYWKMGDYSKARSYYEKVLEISQKNLPPNHPSLAISYNNIGSVCDNMGDYSQALSYHEKALENQQKTLPPNHPDLATSYNNIGAVYGKMGDYSKALSFWRRAMDIGRRSLPANHPDRLV
jgi:tetratricopeptide (TPR) repeat protein